MNVALDSYKALATPVLTFPMLCSYVLSRMLCLSPCGRQVIRKTRLADTLMTMFDDEMSESLFCSVSLIRIFSRKKSVKSVNSYPVL